MTDGDIKPEIYFAENGPILNSRIKTRKKVLDSVLNSKS
jgi:hypothetical protein